MSVRLSVYTPATPLPRVKISDTHFCWRLSRPHGCSVAGRIRSIERLQCSHRKSNPRPSSTYHSASSNYYTAYPPTFHMAKRENCLLPVIPCLHCFFTPRIEAIFSPETWVNFFTRVLGVMSQKTELLSCCHMYGDTEQFHENRIQSSISKS
jgi:hypothetical protein